MLKKILIATGIILLLIGITGYFHESVLIFIMGILLILVAWAKAVADVSQENPGI